MYDSSIRSIFVVGILKPQFSQKFPREGALHLKHSMDFFSFLNNRKDHLIQIKYKIKH